MPELPDQQKKSIRLQMRRIRQQMKGNGAHKAALQLSQQLQSMPLYAKAEKIACFISFDGEIDTDPLIEMIMKDKGNCFLPKLRPGKPNRLWFMPYSPDTLLVNNRFGIPEVDLPVNYAIAISKLDILLMPLVAFDEQGNRLGMGGGFYDATLSHFRLNSEGYKRRPVFIGIAYEQQKVEKIPTQPWDFALDGVLTQNNFYQWEHALSTFE